jgi:predicted enzyme related to lactoylglutathione lyase
MSKHPIVHIEFAAHDPKASAKFYSELFGWPITEAPEFNYSMFDAGDGVGGGFVTIGGESGTKSGDVLVYVSTDDIEASLAKAVSLGSTVISPNMEVPGQGWFAVFTDPGGNKVGLWKQA